MPLTSLPVTAGELVNLQFSLTFTTNLEQATVEAAAINAHTDTVAKYAFELLQANIGTSQVAMAVTCLMLGDGPPAGVGSPDVAVLDNIATNFLPDQLFVAAKFGFNPVVYASEALGLALAGTPVFASNIEGWGEETFVEQVVGPRTGVNEAAIHQFISNWVNFYTANPSATFGLTVKQAAYGAAFGDAIGVALVNQTQSGVQTTLSDQGAIQGTIANLLIDIAEGSYVAGVNCLTLPQHEPLQGEPKTVVMLGEAPSDSTADWLTLG
jgi:hypothetical protein